MKYTKEKLEKLVIECYSYAELMRKLNLFQAGGTHSYLKKLITQYNISTLHFTGKSFNKGKTSNKKAKAEDILVYSKRNKREKTHRLVRALKEINIPYICSICKINPFWNELVLTLQVDHINANPLDNRKENLRFLCPNCHSQQSSFSRRKS